MYVELRLPADAPRIELKTTVGKQANRMPEALWFSFQPDTPDDAGWTLEKAGELVVPLGVVAGGGRTLHAIGGGIRYRDAAGALEIASLDAPVVAVGLRSQLNFSMEQPDLRGGFHFSLFNNAWAQTIDAVEKLGICLAGRHFGGCFRSMACY